jgi:hypothetical protein
MPLKVLLILLGSVALGVALLVLGLRGKRINTHPVCRQCRFDLSGQPEGTVTCPECGAGLKRPGFVRIGQRRRRPVWIGLGTVAVGLLAIGSTGFAMLTGQNVHQWLPLGFLLWEARHADATRGQQVAAEVLGRQNAKKLNESQFSQAVETALDIQADVSIPWATEWGDLIEARRSQGSLSDEQLHRFLNHAAAPLTWKVRPRVIVGDPIPVLATLTEARIGSASTVYSMVRFKGASVNGSEAHRATERQPASPANPQVGWFQMYGRAGRFGPGAAPVGQARLVLAFPSTVAPGAGRAKVELAVQTRIMTGGTIVWGEPKEGDPEVRVMTGEVDFSVLPADSPGIEIVQPSATEREKMEEALTPRQLELYVYSNGLSAFGGSATAQTQLSVEQVPLPGAFSVFWRVGGREFPAGAFTTGTSTDSNQNMYWAGQEHERYPFGAVAGFSSDTVDVILRPDADAALRTLDVERIYGSEILYKDRLVSTQNVGAAPGMPKKSKGPNLMEALQRMFGPG